MSIDLKFVELTADVLEIFFIKISYFWPGWKYYVRQGWVCHRLFSVHWETGCAASFAQSSSLKFTAAVSVKIFKCCRVLLL